MKKLLHLLVILVLVALPVLVSAQATTTASSTLVDAPSSQMKFIPLTNVPFIQEAGGAFNLTDFLNGLFRVCIGIAAVVAVLQIMRAGIMYMGSDSGFAEKKEAKNLIALSIGGLILVLSPVVVFSVINPEILSLKIAGVEDLAVAEPDPLAPPGGTDDEGNALSSFNGPYLFGRQFRTVEGARAMIGFCNEQVIPESLKEVIHEYKVGQLEADFGSEFYVRYCESFSKSFYYYARTAGLIVDNSTKSWVTAEYERAATTFKNGCAANGGRLVEDADGVVGIRDWFGCSDAHADIIKERHPNMKPSDFLCLHTEFQCRGR